MTKEQIVLALQDVDTKRAQYLEDLDLAKEALDRAERDYEGAQIDLRHNENTRKQLLDQLDKV